MYIHPLNNEVQKNSSSLLSSNSDETGKESIFMSFNDDDGIIQKTDIQFANKKSEEIATPYLTFLDKYCDGKHNWTTALKDMVQLVIHYFNDCYKNGEIDTKRLSVGNTEISYFKNHKLDKVYFQYDNENLINCYISPSDGDSTNIDYRTNGTILKKEYYDNDYSIEEYYNQEEKLKYKTARKQPPRNEDHEVIADGVFIKERFEGNRRLKEVYSTKIYGFRPYDEIVSRVIYENDDELIRTDYKNKKVINFTDNRAPEEKPIFDKTKLNGKFDNLVRQGFSGVCYMVGITNSMISSENKENLQDLDNCVSYDKERGIGTVIFKGLNRTYSFPIAEIEKHMARLGTEDPDFPLMALGYEQYLLEDDDNNIKDVDLSSAPTDAHREVLEMLAQKPPNTKTIDERINPADFYYAITGKFLNASELNDESFNAAKESLNKGGIVNAGTSENGYDEFMNHHNYSVISIDDENVKLLEPNSLEEIICPIEKFKQRFIAIFYN